MNNVDLSQLITDPRRLFDDMMRNNPEFAKFVNDNKGKSAEQIARENNIDLSMLSKLINRK